MSVEGSVPFFLSLSVSDCLSVDSHQDAGGVGEAGSPVAAAMISAAAAAVHSAAG